MDKLLNIAYNKLVVSFLPIIWRKPKTIAYLTAIISPLITLLTAFKNHRLDAIYRLTHTGQVWSIEKVLNDKYDNTQRRIYLRKPFSTSRCWLYTRPEKRPLFLDDQVIIPNPKALQVGSIDFIVVIPLDLKLANQTSQYGRDAAIKGLIDYYKLHSKNYILSYE